MRLSLNFTLSEFEAASHRALDDEEKRKAREWWAPMVLQPARNELGPLRISSYVRTGDRIGGGTHANGDGIDVVPLAATVDDLWQWYRARPWLYGQLIHERDHIHMTRPGVRGKWGEVLIEPVEGVYQFGGALLPALPVLLALAGLVLVLIVLFY